MADSVCEVGVYAAGGCEAGGHEGRGGGVPACGYVAATCRHLVGCNDGLEGTHQRGDYVRAKARAGRGPAISVRGVKRGE